MDSMNSTTQTTQIRLTQIGTAAGFAEIGSFTRASVAVRPVGQQWTEGGSATAAVALQVTVNGSQWTTLATLDPGTGGETETLAIDISAYSQARWFVSGAESGITVECTMYAYDLPYEPAPPSP